MEDKSIIAAANGFFINNQEEILLLRRLGSDLWLTLAGIIKPGTNPKAALEAKAKKRIKFKGRKLAKLFDSGFVDDVLMIRFIVSEFSGEIKLGDKYEEFAWVKLSDIKDRSDVCPYVKKSFTKIADINELDNFENKYKLALADYQNL